MSERSVRYLTYPDVELITRYWLEAEPSFLEGMGVDLSKMPTKEAWRSMLEEQLNLPIPEKKSYGLIWLVDGDAVGHCNINKIQFGKEAFMHLHLWNTGNRRKGMGQELVRKSLPFFFEQYCLETLYCEPYALNPAPNKTLERVGFQFVKEYVTTPGWLNFEQPVNLWALSRERFERLQ